jgi:hypothetical protein
MELRRPAVLTPENVAGSFVENGRIGLTGEMPLNIDGGWFSAGRLHGDGYVHEECTQLWSRGELRQVSNDLIVAVPGIGGGPWAGSLLLRRD